MVQMTVSACRSPLRRRSWMKDMSGDCNTAVNQRSTDPGEGDLCGIRTFVDSRWV
jgi:hypothetical protein